MNRNMDLLFGVIAPTDITVETTSSTSIVSRAEVIAGAIGPHRLASLLDRLQLRGPTSGSGGQESAEACIAHAQE